MLCDHLEGWDGEGGREGDARRKKKKKKIYSYISESFPTRRVEAGKHFSFILI